MQLVSKADNFRFRLDVHQSSDARRKAADHEKLRTVIENGWCAPRPVQYLLRPAHGEKRRYKAGDSETRRDHPFSSVPASAASYGISCWGVALGGDNAFIYSAPLWQYALDVEFQFENLSQTTPGAAVFVPSFHFPRQVAASRINSSSSSTTTASLHDMDLGITLQSALFLLLRRALAGANTDGWRFTYSDLDSLPEHLKRDMSDLWSSILSIAKSGSEVPHRLIK